jgi:CheY-specific phosphatase CheX
MTRSAPDQALFESAAEVLETMFFTSLVGEGAPESSPGPWVSADLCFRGSLSGRFGVRLPVATARRIAASFLGEEEESLDAARAGEVVCELSNMLCGSVLSRLESEAAFELSHPQFDPQGSAWPDDPQSVRRLLESEDGPMALRLDLDRLS